MISPILLATLFYITASITFPSHNKISTNIDHKYWFIKDNPLTGNDDKWNYCDYKCLAFENRVSNKDFVVVVLSAPLKEKFAVCYVKTGSTYTLWSKVTENTFYEKYCGEDYKDWIAEGGFKVDGVFGVGIGAIFNETEAYGH